MHEHRARKRFGQNFLQDAAVIRDIVRAVNPQRDDTVIEIGPGLAAITEPLAERLTQLHVVEIDRDIVARLRTLPFAGKLVIHEGDVLDFDFDSVPGRKKIVGNLPYNISTPLLLRFGAVRDIADMHFMLQKEVVERMVALPESKDYGRLSVMLQYYFEMESLIDVPPEAFRPAPKVDSAVVRMIPNHGRIGLAEDFNHFAALVKRAFAQRRKTIHNNLKHAVSDSLLEAAGILPNQRPEDIAPHLFVALSNELLHNGILREHL